MVQSIAHIAEYICVPNLNSILDGSEYSVYSRYICVPNKGGLYHIFRKFDFFSSPCHNFFPLSSVQINIIPACCLLCVL